MRHLFRWAGPESLTNDLRRNRVLNNFALKAQIQGGPEEPEVKEEDKGNVKRNAAFVRPSFLPSSRGRAL